MTYDPSQDPRLTAYALGELPAAERADVERLLAESAEARRFVEETGAFAASLERDLAFAPQDGLTPAQRVAVQASAATTDDAPAGRVLRVARWPVPAGLAAAALVAVAFLGRNAVGRWWTGDDERDVASAERLRYSVRVGTYGHGGGGHLAAPPVPPVAAHPAEAPATATAQPHSMPPYGLGTGGEYVRNGIAPDPKPVDELAERAAELRQRLEELKKDPELTAYSRKSAEPSGDTFVGTLLVPPPAPAPGAEEGGALVAGMSRSNTPPGAKPAGAPVADGRAAWSRDTSGSGVVAEDVRRAVEFLKAEGLHDAALTTAAFDVEIAQAAQIADAEKRRAALCHIIERARTTHPPTTGEGYRAVADNPFLRPTEAPLSTFGLDVDTASYANVRRFLTGNQLPPPAAVRVEELVNYFPYRYAPPTDGAPLAAHVEVAGCPWNAQSRLVRVALKAREVPMTERPAANLVFLVDVSGSMEPANKLPLLVQSMKQLVPTLTERDRVAIVTYADGAQVVLPSTTGDRRDVILGALDALRAGGSTNGAAGIQTAYDIAQQHFAAGGINRVLLATDGDFNVGVTSDDQLVRMIEEKARSKVFLTILGFGEGNLQDGKMEAIADRGNGQYAYVDSLREGRKVLVDQAAGTLVTVAKDVKLQVEFNPVRVASYRLIGYENRALAAADFRDDAKDAGDLGAGHTVTALYEIVPTASAAAGVEGLRYQQGVQPTPAAHSDELLTVKMRWKLPEASESTGRELPVRDTTTAFAQASEDFRFAAAVAEFGMLLRGSPYAGQATFQHVIDVAAGALGEDAKGHRAEFVDLARRAKALSGR